MIGTGQPSQLNMKGDGSDGKGVRIDFGGTLFYRAMGGFKKDWNADPNELFTMSGTWPNNAGEVFRYMTGNDYCKAREVLMRLTDDYIVKETLTYLQADIAKKTADILIKRKKKILEMTEKYNECQTCFVSGSAEQHGLG